MGMKRGSTGSVPLSDDEAYDYGIRKRTDSQEDPVDSPYWYQNSQSYPHGIWYPDRIARSMGTNYFLTKKRSFDPLGSQLYYSGLNSKFFKRKRAFNGPSQVANFMGLDYFMN